MDNNEPLNPWIVWGVRIVVVLILLGMAVIALASM